MTNRLYYEDFTFYLQAFSLLSNVWECFLQFHKRTPYFLIWIVVLPMSLSVKRQNHITSKGWLILMCWPSSSTGKGPGKIILSIFLSSKPPSNHFLQGNMNSRARRPSPSFTITWLRNQPPPKFAGKKIKIFKQAISPKTSVKCETGLTFLV